MNNSTDITPIFLLSLPRSGSTLLQRILSSYSEISSAAEPWVLLPFLYPLKSKGTYAEYSHFCVYSAINDLTKEMPNGKADYYATVQAATINIYNKVATPKAKYFLDKTPRYTLIADDIPQVFPDAKIIILWRNPLAIIASIIKTFNSGKWKIFHSKVDLFDGMKNLISLQKKYKDKDKILVINYEDLISNPEKTLHKITLFLGIDYNASALDSFSTVKYKGTMGDPTGRDKYKTISQDSMHSWKKELSNYWRKYWCTKYLNWVGEDDLLLIGYDLNKLKKDLSSTSSNWKGIIPDLCYSFYGELYSIFELKIMKDKIKSVLHENINKKHD